MDIVDGELRPMNTIEIHHTECAAGKDNIDVYPLLESTKMELRITICSEPLLQPPWLQSEHSHQFRVVAPKTFEALSMLYVHHYNDDGTDMCIQYSEHETEKINH